MKSQDLTRHLLAELHRTLAATLQTRAVLQAMEKVATDPVLVQTLANHVRIAEDEHGLVNWLLAEQGESQTPTESRPVAVMAHDGWLAATEEDPQLRDLEIATVCTQLQSFHLASWLGTAACLRVLQLHEEADHADALTTRLRALEREIETLRPSLAQLEDNPNDSTAWYRPSNRRHHGNFSSTDLRL